MTRLVIGCCKGRKHLIEYLRDGPLVVQLFVRGGVLVMGPLCAVRVETSDSQSESGSTNLDWAMQIRTQNQYNR